MELRCQSKGYSQIGKDVCIGGRLVVEPISKDCKILRAAGA